MINFSFKNYNLHLISLAIFSLSYILSLFFFGEVVINPHDNLDIGPIYNKIVSKIYKGEFDSVKLLQAENFKWYFLDKIFYPINLFNIILDNKEFYFFEEIIKKILSYFSFFLLSRHLIKNPFYSMIGAIIYTTLTNIIAIPHSYFIPFAPYFFYLLLKKEKISLKYFFLILVVGLNSSLIFDYLSIGVIFFLFFILKNKEKGFKFFYQFFLIFSFGCFLSSTPMIFTFLNIETHRELFQKIEFLDNLKNHFFLFINYFRILDVEDFFNLPIKILFFMVILNSFFLKDKNVIKIFLILLIFYCFSIILESNVINFIFIGPLTFLKGFNFTRFSLIFPLILSLIIIYHLNFFHKKKYKNFVVIFIFICSILLQIQFFIKEFSKSFFFANLQEDKWTQLKKNTNNKKIFLNIIFNKENYKNNFNFAFEFQSSNTFDNYYRFNEYSELKKLINNGITISVGLNPMIAAMNDIKIADGYYIIISREYKKQFRKIIEKELEINQTLKNYFDDWGNRLYSFFSNQENLLLDFKQAKNLDILFVISSFKINNLFLEEICSPCNEKKDLNLYKIIY